jgi:hypothetical protein
MPFPDNNRQHIPDGRAALPCRAEAKRRRMRGHPRRRSPSSAVALLRRVDSATLPIAPDCLWDWYHGLKQSKASLRMPCCCRNQ